MFWNFTEKLLGENRYLKLCCLIQAIALAGAIFVIGQREEKTVVIPAALRGEFWTTNKEVSSSYVEQVALYIADRLLTVSPETVDESFEKALIFFSTDPKILKALKEQLADIKVQIKENSYYQSFFPKKVYLTGKKLDTVVVEGKIRRLVGEQFEEEKPVMVRMGYTVRHGRLYITSFELR